MKTYVLSSCTVISTDLFHLFSTFLLRGWLHLISGWSDLICFDGLQGTQIQATMFKDAADKFFEVLQLDKVVSEILAFNR